jgi:hypothetical protein
MLFFFRLLKFSAFIEFEWSRQCSYSLAIEPYPVLTQHSPDPFQFLLFGRSELRSVHYLDNSDKCPDSVLNQATTESFNVPSNSSFDVIIWITDSIFKLQAILSFSLCLSLQSGLYLLCIFPNYICRDSVVGIATGYGLVGRGSSPIAPKPTLEHTQPPIQWAPGESYPWGESGRGVKLTPSPLFIPEIKNGGAIPAPPPTSSWRGA